MGAIACPSAGTCSAVGFYLDTNGNNSVLLLGEQGGNWKANALVFPRE